MLSIKREGVLLRSTQLYFENGGVLNPAVFQDGNLLHMFYRSIQSGGVSMIAYCMLDGPLNIAYRATEPVIVPEFAYEAFGVEDPRIVKIDDMWYLTYTAWDGEYALAALATSTDMASFVKRGFIVPRITYERFFKVAGREMVNKRYFSYQEKLLWNKNVMFFPRRIHGKLCFLHRVRPGILIAEIDDLSQLNEAFWMTYFKDLHLHILLEPLYKHESFCIGGGCPPLETRAGWLLIYHGIEDGPEGYIYSACVALLDIDDPHKVIGRLPYALLLPEESWERSGNTNNVVFPTGTALFKNRLYIYYGAADTCIGVASVELDEFLNELIYYGA